MLKSFDEWTLVLTNGFAINETRRIFTSACTALRERTSPALK